jgi:hypothetical protein
MVRARTERQATMGQLTKLPFTAKVAVALVCACVATGLGSLRGAPRGEAMDDWHINDLVSRLEQNGMEFRTLPTQTTGPLNEGAFVTTTDKSFLELNGLGVFPERMDQWQGTVKCYLACRKCPQWAPQTELWTEECYCRIGPFLLFGDPELRGRICKLLRDSGVSLK